MTKSKILMLGDSLIDFGNWRNLLPEYTVISRGVPGEMAEELLWRLADSFDHKSVDAILVMTGTNNLFTGDDDFTETIQLITTRLRNNYPDSIIILNSLVPFQVPQFQETIRSVNRDLQSIASSTETIYFDLYTHFAKASLPLFDYDGVHFSNEGYRIWAHLLSTELRTLLAKQSD